MHEQHKEHTCMSSMVKDGQNALFKCSVSTVDSVEEKSNLEALLIDAKGFA